MSLFSRYDRAPSFSEFCEVSIYGKKLMDAGCTLKMFDNFHRLGAEREIICALPVRDKNGKRIELSEKLSLLDSDVAIADCLMGILEKFYCDIEAMHQPQYSTVSVVEDAASEIAGVIILGVHDET